MKFLKRIFGEIKESQPTERVDSHFDQYRSELKARALSSLDDLEALVKPLILEATKIVVHPASRPPENSQMISHFGGDRYFERGEKWPTVNGKQLSFVCQLHDSAGQFLPNGIKLVQFYYDFDEFPWDTNDQGWLVKTYKGVNVDETGFLDKPKELEKPKYCEVSLERVMSLPDWEGLHRHSNLASMLSCVLNEDEPWDSYDTVVTKLIGEQDYRSQIGGYPRWVQGESTPEAPNGEVMKLLLQIDSEDNAGLMWGDVGLIYVFYDPENIANLGFQLQCH